MLVVGCGGGVGVEYVVTVTALFRRIDGGGESVLVWGGFSYHNRTAHQVCRGRKNAICYREQVVPIFHFCQCYTAGIINTVVCTILSV